MRTRVRFPKSVIPVALALGLVAACGDDPEPEPEIVSIEITPAAPSMALDTTQQLTATAVFDDDSTENVTARAQWSSSDDAVATVSASGLATAEGGGTATITARLDGVSGTTTLTVTQAALVSIAVTPPTPSVAAGLDEQLTATGTFSDDTTQDLTDQVEWTSSDDAVASVSDAGLAAGEAPGTARITATLGDISGEATISVTDAELVSLAITPAAPTISAGTSLQLTATGTFTDDSTDDLTHRVTWVSSDAAIASVVDDGEDKGTASGVSVGTATITASLDDISGSTDVTVSDSPLVSIEVAPAAPSVALGFDQAFTATGTFADDSTQDLTTQVTWASSDAGIATISNADDDTRGVATTVAAGATTISATFDGIEGSTELTVTDAILTAIQVTPAGNEIAERTELQFTATGVFSDDSTADVTGRVTWASSDAAVAAISNADGSRGLATSIVAGVVTISAADGDVSGSTELTVSDVPLVSISVAPNDRSIALGTGVQFTATGTFADDFTQDLTGLVTWSTDDADVATVSNADGSRGRATSVGAGATTVFAVFEGVNGQAALTISALESIAVAPAAPSVPLGIDRAFTATGTLANGATQDLTAEVTWSSSDEEVAIVSNAAGSEGLASTRAVGVADITAAFGELAGATALTVNDAVLVELSIEPVDPIIALGRDQQLQAFGTFTDATVVDITDQVTWTAADSAIAEISNADGSEGLVSSAAVGATEIAAELDGVRATAQLTVTDAELVEIVVDPPEASIALGLEQAFTATGRFSDNSSQDLTSQVVWSSSDASIADVSNADGSAGLTTSVAVGTVQIAAELDGVRGEAPLAVTDAEIVAIEVSPAAPSIALGLEQALTATGTFTDDTVRDLTAQVTWSSSNDAVAAVSNADGAQGIASAVGVGTAAISASIDDVAGEVSMTVTDAALVALAVAPDVADIALGTQQRFTVVGTFTDDSTLELTTQVAWSSSDPSIAEVSNAAGTEGLATSRNLGSATITASLDGVGGSASLEVTDAELLEVAIEPIADSIALGTSVRFRAIGTFTNGDQDLTSQVTWSSSSPDVASISNAAGSEGLATSLSEGTTTIAATFGGETVSTDLSVVEAELLSIEVAPATATVAIGGSQQLTAIGRFTTGEQDLTDQVVWSSTATDIAEVSNAAESRGVVTGLAAGDASVVASFDGVNGSAAVTVE